MAKRIKIGRLRLIITQSSPLLKIAVAGALVICTVAVLALRITVLRTEKRNEQLQAQAMQYEQENSDLRQWLADIGSEQSIRRIAGAELGLVDPGTKLFTPSD